MSLEDIVFETCQMRESEYFYVGENIPERKLSNAIKEFSIPADEVIYALVDATVFGSAKNGVVFTNKGFHIRNSWTGDMREGFMDWKDLQYAEFDSTKALTKNEVWIDNLQIELSGSSLTPPILKQTFIVLQEEILKYYKQDEKPAEKQQPKKNSKSKKIVKWMLASDGNQYGPYGEQDIIDMIESSQVFGDKDYVWQQGMTEWALLNDCPPFNAFFTPNLPPPLTTPPLPEHTATDEQYEQIDVNEATISDLLSLPYFSLEIANALLLKRKELGGQFNSMAEIQEVVALQPHEFEKVKQYLSIKVEQKTFARRSGRMIDY